MNTKDITVPQGRSDTPVADSHLDEGGAQAPQQESEVRSLLYVVWGVFLDAGMAVGTYLALRAFDHSEYFSLLMATIVAGIRLGYVMIRRREVDGFALFMVASFGIGLSLSLIAGSPKFLLAKESIGTTASGILFLATCVWGKPLMYYAARRFSARTPQERDDWEEHWRTLPEFRKAFRFLSVVWGVAFIIEACVRLPFVYLLPVDVMATISPLVTPIMITLLLIWTFKYLAKAPTRMQEADQVPNPSQCHA